MSDKSADIPKLLDLIHSGGIEAYRGPVEVFVERRLDLLVIAQGDRYTVMTRDQAMTLIEVMMFKLGGGA